MTRLTGETMANLAPRSIARKIRLRSPGRHDDAYLLLNDSRDDLPRTSTSSPPSYHRTSDDFNYTAYSVTPLPRRLTDRIPMELYERMIAALHPDRKSISKCSLVSREWNSTAGHYLFGTLYVKPKPINRGMGEDVKRVTCAVHLRKKNAVLYGMDDGIYFNTNAMLERYPTKVMNIEDVQQLDLLVNGALVLFRAAGVVYSVPLSSLELHSGNVFDITICQRITANALLYNVGRCAGREMMCIVKEGTVSSTCKVFQPHTTAEKLEMALFKVFYLPEPATSVQFHKSSVILGTNGFINTGFEVLDLETYAAQPLIDATDSRLDFAKDGKCLAARKVGAEFLLCYTRYAFYITEAGRLARGHIIRWEHKFKSIVFHDEHLIGVTDKGLEVRNVVTGRLVQFVPLGGIRILTGVSSSIMMTARQDGWIEGLEFPPRKVGSD